MVLATIFQNGVSIEFYIVLSTILFVIGMIGVMIRRNAINVECSKPVDGGVLNLFWSS